MTNLFSVVERTRVSGRRYNESSYSFLNTSAWPSVRRVREFWEGWFTEYPEDKRMALAARFRSLDDHAQLSAFLELFTFAVLRRSGYELQVEPPAGDLALEFLTKGEAGHPSFYVECTATGRHKSQVGEDALEADLLEAINKAPTGRFLLEVEVEARGAGAPAAKPLRAELARWLASLDVDQVADTFNAAQRLPEWTWQRDGWRVTFRAIPTIGSEDDGRDAVGMILSTFVPDQHKRLRAAMDAKASKYGSLEKPLLVAVNSTQFQHDEDLLTALLGDVVWHIDFSSNTGTTDRTPNGVFYDAKGPRNANVGCDAWPFRGPELRRLRPADEPHAPSVRNAPTAPQPVSILRGTLFRRGNGYLGEDRSNNDRRGVLRPGRAMAPLQSRPAIVAHSRQI